LYPLVFPIRALRLRRSLSTMVAVQVFFSVFVVAACVQEPQCRMDFSPKCPRGWQELEEDACLAPLSYTGPCDMLARIPPTWGAAQKKQWMDLCGGASAIPWPCVETCPLDVSRSSCPVAWVDFGDELCDAPLSLGGPCSEMRVRRAIGGDDLKEFEVSCGAFEMSCSGRCIENFTAACPYAWTYVDGLCLAPRSYAGGPCLPFQNLLEMSDQEKERWSGLCHAPFPCKGVAVGACEPMPPCPDLWDVIGTAELIYCRAPSTYEGACRPVMSASDLRHIGKHAFASRCNVSWACTADEKPEVDPPVNISGPVYARGKLYGLLDGYA